MSDSLLYQVKDHVAHITLNRPDQMNALTMEMRRRWPQIIDEFNNDPDARVGILSGAGDRAFCAGIDLKETAQRDKAPKTRAKGGGAPTTPQKPLIAAVNGYCVAGGMELALMCDIRIASASARFGLMEARRSLIPVYAVNLLPRIVPLGEAAYLLLTGDIIEADRALRIGLAQEVLPDREALLARAEHIAQSILLGAPLAVQAIRELSLATREMPLTHGYKLATAAYHQLLTTEDAKEGPRAFAEKRKT